MIRLLDATIGLLACSELSVGCRDKADLGVCLRRSGEGSRWLSRYSPTRS